MELPDADTPAIDEVNRKTPPSVFALKVGKALRRRCKLALQFTAQHWKVSLSGMIQYPSTTYLVPITFTQGIKVSKGREFCPALSDRQLR